MSTPTSGLRQSSKRFRWSRIDASLPGGIHDPKHAGDCGFDLESMRFCKLAPGEAQDVPINCRIEIPSGYWASVKARSSIVRRGLQVDAGIIDNGYRGPLWAVTRNVSDDSVIIERGERVAQLVFHRLHEVWSEEVQEINIAGTSRADAGFGSTGT